MELKDLYSYEVKIDSKTKRTLGVVYTPLNVAFSMVYLSVSSWIRNKTGKGLNELDNREKIELLDNIKILDPCTGTGVFLQAILAVMNQLYSEADIEFKADAWMKKCLFATDIDSKAIDNARYYLKGIWGISDEVLNSNLVVGDSVFNHKGLMELVPRFDKNHIYWNTILNEDNIGTEYDDEFPVDDGDTVLKLYDSYINNRLDTEARYNYLAKALDYNSIDVSSWNMNEMPLSYYLEFMDVFTTNEGFDIVIGNPPYVSIRNVNGNTDELRKYRAFNTSADLSLYFYELAYNLINKDGVVCMISSNSWLNARYAVEFRSWLFDNNESKIKYLIDFKDTDIFSTANVLVAITVLDKQKKSMYKSLYGDKGLISSNLESRLLSGKDVYINNNEKEGLRVSSDVEISIKEKYNEAKLQTQIKNYCTFKSGLTTGGKELFKVNEELFNKYPHLVKKAQDCKNLMAGTYFYMLYIPTGVYSNIKALPEEVIYILESRREQLESRDATTIGEEWYSVKHGVNRISNDINCSIINVSDDIRIYDMEEGTIPVDAAMICASAPKWVKNYLSNRIINALYNVGSEAGNCRNSNRPRKSAREINEIPVPFILAECEDITDELVCKAFNLNDTEIIYLLNSEEI